MTLSKLMIAWARMIRLPILFLCCFGAVVGALNTAVFLNAQVSLFQIFILILAPAFLSVGTMVHNDVTDLKSDKVNRPYKPLPAGIIKEKTAYFTGLSLMFASIIIALFVNINDTGELNWNCTIFTAFLVFVGIYYNYYGKYHGIFGHISVSIGVGAIPYWGAIAIFPNELIVMLPLAIAIFFQEVGREIMVCVGDYHGDLKAGFKTTPVKLGRKRSMYVALIFYLAFIPLFPLPAFDWVGIGVPQLFGTLYLIGGSLLAMTFILTWLLSYIEVLKGDEKRIWNAFERYERIGTRLMIIVFQIFILLEVFY
jgi:geranylgeranylglycerol-phosphate geranylgeranyltransferase